MAADHEFDITIGEPAMATGPPSASLQVDPISLSDAMLARALCDGTIVEVGGLSWVVTRCECRVDAVRYWLSPVVH